MRYLSVTRVKEGELGEALKKVHKEFAHYIDIEGFESSIEVWGTAREGLEVAGLEIPPE